MIEAARAPGPWLVEPVATYRRVTGLRVPLADPEAPEDWKDWYHFNLFHPASGTRVLANLCLAGGPGRGEIQTTLLATVPQGSELPTFGNARSQPWRPAAAGRAPLRVVADEVRFAVDGERFELGLGDGQGDVDLAFSAAATAAPLLVDECAPFGSGFIGWGLVPGLRVHGKLRVCGREVAVDPTWYGYHDHNFGRFRWGEDIGWEWLVARGPTAAGRELVVVLDRRTSKDHRDGGLPFALCCVDGVLRKVFLGPGLAIRWTRHPRPGLPPRLPGAMASLFGDRAVALPARLGIDAADERDRLVLAADFETGLELVVPDDRVHRYTFMSELTGRAAVELRLGGERFAIDGLVYAEYVA